MPHCYTWECVSYFFIAAKTKEEEEDEEENKRRGRRKRRRQRRRRRVDFGSQLEAVVHHGEEGRDMRRLAIPCPESGNKDEENGRKEVEKGRRGKGR